jgi:DNA-binding SARP family transcriptional activator
MDRAPRHLLGRLLVRAVAALALTAILIGLPAGLVLFVGWPLPHTVPTLGQLTGWLTSPISDTVIVHALAVAAWLLWAGFIPAVASEAWAARRGLPTPATTGTTHNPLRIGAAALITALALGGLPTAGLAVVLPTAGDASARPAVTHALRLQSVAQHTAGREGPATIHVGARRYSYTVVPGDSLSRIAAAWLGDPNRWPEICRANWHRHWTGVGGTLTDCDLIFPGWDLRLPEGATPPPDARPLTPTRAAPSPDTRAPAASAPPPPSIAPPSQNPGSSSPVAGGNPAVTATPTPTDAGPTPTTPTLASPTLSASDPTAGTVPTPATATGGTISAPHPTGPAAASGHDHAPPAPTVGADGHGAADGQRPEGQRAAARQGIHVGDSYLPWALAGAVAAAVALVWLQRRRRHTPDSTGDDPTDLPTPVLAIHQEVALHPGLPTHPDLAERAAGIPDHPPIPPGGVGLVGPGAPAAARALLVAMLASGGPRDPDRQGEVVIDGTTLTTLIGADAAALGPWPRLHVADDPDHALRLIEARLLHRARILDEHTVTDLDALRDRAPDEQPLPPVLLIGETPPAGARMRTQAALTVGADLGITAVLLGPWPHGATLDVDPDGHARRQNGDHEPGEDPNASDGLAVLDTDTAVAILATLREAHTGCRPAITLPGAAPTTPAATAEQAATASTATVEPDPHRPAPTGVQDVETAVGKARLRVLGGPPRVEDVTAPGNPLRAKAGELAVFLACHRDGADTRTLRDRLEPGVRIRSADTRVHTNVSNLRHVLSRAGGPRKPGYVTQTAGRYHLDPASVHVDLWQFRDLLARARTTDEPQDRIPLLQQACDLYGGPLAADCDYPWVEAHREKARQEATDAHLLLAGDLIQAGDPHMAADLLDTAIGFDPYNEAVYQAAFRARHALGDRDGIHGLLHTLDVALADLDAEPEEATRELADRLARSIPASRPNRARRDDGDTNSQPR